MRFFIGCCVRKARYEPRLWMPLPATNKLSLSHYSTSNNGIYNASIVSYYKTNHASLV